MANASNTLSSGERSANQLQIDSLLNSVDRVANSSNFVGNTLLDGTAKLQSGNTTVTIPNMTTAQLGTTVDNNTTYTLSDLRSGGRLASGTNAELADKVVSQAINNVSTARGMVGALQTNQIEATVASITNASIQLSASRSGILDTDYPTEFTNLMRYSITYKANLLALKNANERTGTLLSILG
jgi:flagellin